jgi:hypothetical protein
MLATLRPANPRRPTPAERFNGRIGAEVLGITIYSHSQLEQLLRGFNAAYNARRQRVLEGQTPDQVVAERLADKPALAKDKPSGQARPCDITKARLIAENTKVSQPDTADVNSILGGCSSSLRCVSGWPSRSPRRGGGDEPQWIDQDNAQTQALPTRGSPEPSAA